MLYNNNLSCCNEFLWIQMIFKYFRKMWNVLGGIWDKVSLLPRVSFAAISIWYIKTDTSIFAVTVWQFTITGSLCSCNRWVQVNVRQLLSIGLHSISIFGSICDIALSADSKIKSRTGNLRKSQWRAHFPITWKKSLQRLHLISWLTKI